MAGRGCWRYNHASRFCGGDYRFRKVQSTTEVEEDGNRLSIWNHNLIWNFPEGHHREQIENSNKDGGEGAEVGDHQQRDPENETLPRNNKKYREEWLKSGRNCARTGNGELNLKEYVSLLAKKLKLLFFVLKTFLC